jgi:hypothetical protein
VRRIVVSGVVLAALAGGGCSSAPDPGPVFDDEGGRPVSCMVHQAEEPGARYTDPALRKTPTNLALLRYYTAHGAKPYCDGAPATAADRAWAQVYVELVGTAEKVPTVLG